MKRPIIVAGNHKMHFDREAFADYVESLNALMAAREADLRVMVVVIPSFVHLEAARALMPLVSVGAQDCHSAREGAFTGEVSAFQLRSYGCSYVIIGHSERRRDFGEAEPLLLEKIRAALEAGLTPIYCCGETLPDRESGRHEAVVAHQVEAVFQALEKPHARRMVVAYEPVWAIGTGKTATPEQAQAMHAFIRTCIAKHHGDEVAQGVPILYGGSVKPGNAAALFAQPDVDGGLVGGASLRPSDFVAIIDAAHEVV